MLKTKVEFSSARVSGMKGDSTPPQATMGDGKE
jgi:hypothetical protein